MSWDIHIKTIRPVSIFEVNITYNLSDMYYKCVDKEKGLKIFDGMSCKEALPILQKAIEDLIDNLKEKGMKMAVVTNKPQALAVKIVETLFPDTFVAVYGQQDLYPIKPDPQSTYLALMAMKLDKKDCLFIGDSQVDIDTGYNAEIDSIGVTWGFRGYQELNDAGADDIVDKPAQIMEIIQR